MNEWMKNSLRNARNYKSNIDLRWCLSRLCPAVCNGLQMVGRFRRVQCRYHHGSYDLHARNSEVLLWDCIVNFDFALVGIKRSILTSHVWRNLGGWYRMDKFRRPSIISCGFGDAIRWMNDRNVSLVSNTKVTIISMNFYMKFPPKLKGHRSVCHLEVGARNAKANDLI